jgi:hypothetical protein
MAALPPVDDAVDPTPCSSATSVDAYSRAQRCRAW